MLIKILNDAFNISKRIKQIDRGYFICYNTLKKRFEVHNKKQKHTAWCAFCFGDPWGNRTPVSSVRG